MLRHLYQKYQAIMPIGVGALFTIQIFSMFSFSLLYSTLILYATQGMHMNDLLATGITGSFIALNFFLHLLGGYIGGRYISYRGLFCISMALQTIGCILLSIPTTFLFFWGLTIFLSGSGLNSTCINCMVMQLFKPDDKRRETAFLWNYSGVNLGFFIGISLSGYFHLHHAYQPLFMLGAIANMIAFLLMLYHWNILRDQETIYTASLQKKPVIPWFGISLIFLLLFPLRGMLSHPVFTHHLILGLGAAIFVAFIIFSTRQTYPTERHKMYGFIILCIAAFIFWSIYQLAPMGLVLFIERNVDRHVLGYEIAPQWIQNLNTAIIIIGGPILSFSLIQLRKRGIGISISLQFVMALLFTGLAYSLLPLGIHYANAAGLTRLHWIMGAYFLQSIGELFIAPIGYAMIGQLAPMHLRGFMMGMWMMLIGVAAILSGQLSKDALGQVATTDPLITNPIFSTTFSWLGCGTLIASILLFVCTPLITRLTQEKLLNHDDAIAN